MLVEVTIEVLAIIVAEPMPTIIILIIHTMSEAKEITDQPIVEQEPLAITIDTNMQTKTLNQSYHHTSNIHCSSSILCFGYVSKGLKGVN